MQVNYQTVAVVTGTVLSRNVAIKAGSLTYSKALNSFVAAVNS